MRRYPALQLLSVIYKITALVGVAVVLVLTIFFEVGAVRGVQALNAQGVFISQEALFITVSTPILFMLGGLFVCTLVYASGEFFAWMVDVEYGIRTLKRPTRSRGGDPLEQGVAPDPLHPSKQEIKVTRGYDERIREYQRRR